MINISIYEIHLGRACITDSSRSRDYRLQGIDIHQLERENTTYKKIYRSWNNVEKQLNTLDIWSGHIKEATWHAVTGQVLYVYFFCQLMSKYLLPIEKSESMKLIMKYQPCITSDTSWSR